jgi:hypothetical protein
MRKYAFFIIDDTLDNSDDQQAYDEEQRRSSDPIQSSLGRKKNLWASFWMMEGRALRPHFATYPCLRSEGQCLWTKQNIGVMPDV